MIFGGNMQIIYFLIPIIIILSLIFFAWRFASRKTAIPCPSWLGWMVEIDNPFSKTNRANFIIDNLSLEPGMKVLDIGCGPGRLTMPLAEKVGSEGFVYAIDIQDEMLNRVKEKAKLRNLNNIIYKKIRMGEGELENLNADRAVLVTVLGEIPERQKALKEIFDTLKSRGILCISEIIFDPHFQSKRKVLSLVTPLGFKEKLFLGNKIAYTIYFEK